MRYPSRRPDAAAHLLGIRELAAVRRRFGYRRLHFLLTRGGIVVNHVAILRWSQDRNVDQHYIAPGKPQQNAFAKSLLGCATSA